MPTLRLEARPNGVRLLTLDDPQRRNAMGTAMAAELVAAAAALANDPEVRVLVVAGAGKAFCAGADLPELFGDADRAVADVHGRLQRYYRAFFSIHELAFPTIAAVQGAAVGAGLNLAMACDVRIAGPHASFGATFSRIGLHPGGGCTWFLTRTLGPSRALRTLLLGEPLDAEAAIRLGLADGPEEDPLAAALALADRFAAVDGELARHIKRAVGLAVDPGDFGAVVEFESWAQAASASSPQLREWVAQFIK